MNKDDKEDTTIYKVVINHEQQYSILPVDQENPLGWQDTGRTGLKSECLEYIKQVWTDIKPLSLRKKMEEYTQNTTNTVLSTHQVSRRLPPQPLY